MNIPDYISPIVGYRVWQWDRLGLKSLNDEPWFPGLELEANASRCGQRHRAPTNLCTCGIYAAKDFAHLRRIGYLGYGVHGEVYPSVRLLIPGKGGVSKSYDGKRRTLPEPSSSGSAFGSPVMTTRRP